MEKIVIPQPGILVLSDLQFGKSAPDDSGRMEHSFGIEADQAKEWAKEILEAVGSLQRDIHLLVLPGDLTSRGRRDEFLALRVYLDVLLNDKDPKSLRPAGVVFCPGNHDLLASTRSNRLKRFEHYLEFTRQFYLDYWERFGGKRILRAPWMNIHSPTDRRPRKPAPDVDPNNIWTIYDFQDPIYTYVASLNSAADIEQLEDDNWEPLSHYGNLHRDQLNEVKKYLARHRQRFRGLSGLAVLHHNIAHARPVHPKAVRASGQMGIVRNYVEVIETLQDLNFNLVVHGHQHEARVTTEKRYSGRGRPNRRRGTKSVDSPLAIFGAGSAGCKPSELIPGALNHFHFIQLEAGDPVYGRQLSYTTFTIKTASGDSPSPWVNEYQDDVILSLQNERPRLNHTFSLIEQSNIATAPTKKHALERLTAFLRSRVGYPVIGATLVSAANFRDLHCVRLASTFAESDCRLIDELYADTCIPKVFAHRSLMVEIGSAARGDVEEARRRLGVSQYLRFLQSQLQDHETLSVITYWFPETAKSWIGLRVYTNRSAQDESYAAKLDALAFRKLILAVLVYWDLHAGECLYDGLIQADIGLAPEVKGDISPLAESPLPAIWADAIGELFAKPIPDYWGQEEFRRLEAKIYSAKRDIEKLIVYAIIHHVVESGTGRGLFVDNLRKRVARRIGVLHTDLEWKGRGLGKSITPLLVAFWVPFSDGGSGEADWRGGDLHYLLTRDQIVRCAFEVTSRSRAESMAALRSMLSIKMRRYGDLVFDGISAYVRAAEAAYVSLDAYGDPLVSFEKFADLSRKLPEDASNLIEKFRQGSAQRRRLSELEQRFWGRHKKVGVFVAPLWGRLGVEAVVQIQTDDLAIIEILQSIDFFSALDGVSLSIAPLPPCSPVGAQPADVAA